MNLPALEILHVARCTSLTTLKLHTPFLRKLKADKNPLLSEVDLAACLRGITEIDLTDSPKVDLEPVRRQVELKLNLIHDLQEFCIFLIQNFNLQGIARDILEQRDVPEARGKIRTLKVLLEDNIPVEKREAFLNQVMSQEPLSALHLSHNSIREQGAESLARALEKNSILQQLNLCRNSIRERGAESLARTLEKNSTLQQLDLIGNSIGDQGAESLARSLEKNSTLQQLDLRGNSIGVESSRRLTDVAKQKEIELKI